MKKLFDRKTDYMVLAFVIGLALMLGFCEDASAAKWSLEFEHDSNSGSTDFNSGLDRIGARYTFDSGTSLYLAPVIAVGGDIGSGFQFGMGEKLWKRWEGQIQLVYFDNEADGGFTIRRLIGDGPFQLGLGGTYWINDSPGSNSSFTFNLGMRYTF